MIRKCFQADCVFFSSLNCIADRSVLLCFIIYEGTVISFTGCNARFEWNVVATATFFDTTSVIIKNPNGTDISFSDVKTCEVRDDQRIKCAVIKRDEQWFLSLHLILVTTENSGNYTAVIQRLLNIENDINHLIVIGTVISFTGCNARLEWNVVATASFFNTTSVTIKNPNGTDISFSDVKTCEVRDDQRIKCALIKRDEQWFLSLLLILVTPENSGNYTAVIQRLLKIENDIKHLIVIGRPQIKETQKPILHKSFAVECTTFDELNCLSYRWKRNGTYLNFTNPTSILTFTNVTVMDKSIELICHIEIKNCGLMESDHCSLDYLDSDPYTIQPYYGPDKISLSRHESHFYLTKRDYFTIDCFANCKPNCTFWWEGYDTIESEKLVITSFESRMAGEYICYATNRQTNITSKSNSITLHYVKENNLEEDNKGDLRLQEYWMGPVIVSVFLLIVGCFVLVTQCCKNTTKVIEVNSPLFTKECGHKPVSQLTEVYPTSAYLLVVADSRELCRPYVGQRNSEVSQKEVWSSKTTISFPAVYQTTSRRTMRLVYSNVHRKARSLQNLSDQIKCIRDQVIENVSLHCLSSPSNATERETRNHVNTDDSANNKNSSANRSWPTSIAGSANRSRLMKSFGRIKRDKKVARNDHIGSESYEIRKPQEKYFEPKHENELYSAIDEDLLSVYAIEKVTDISSHESSGSTEHVFYDYADVHLADETYLTPVSSLTSPSEICQDQEEDVFEADNTYITPNDELVNPIDVCQVEEIDMNEIDPTYLSPISG